MKESALMTVYKRLPVSFERGEGVWLFDQKGEKYLDALSGIGVCALGHAHPAVTQAIIEQAEKVLHTGNIFTIAEQEALAHELTEFAGMERVFFANSGAEVNEGAIKLARLYGHQRGIENPSIIVFEKAFHGRTLATLSASANRKIQAGYEPLVSGFIRAPYNDLNALNAIAHNSKNIVAIFLEPVLGNAGVIVPDDDYLPGIRKLCDQHQWLMMLDEIQTGVGRTGRNYAYQHYADATPDILTSAKALANGIPIGAVMAKGAASELFEYGRHGSTFGGNPFCCHVARAVLQTIIKEKIAENAAKVGSYLLEQLKQALDGHEHVVAVRGKGLMIGVELDKPCRELYQLGLEQRLLFSVAAESSIRLLPPLILTKEQADMIVERLVKCINQFYKDE